jgi:hypothetical protein
MEFLLHVSGANSQTFFKQNETTTSQKNEILFGIGFVTQRLVGIQITLKSALGIMTPRILSAKLNN